MNILNQSFYDLLTVDRQLLNAAFLFLSQRLVILTIFDILGILSKINSLFAIY